MKDGGFSWKEYNQANWAVIISVIRKKEGMDLWVGAALAAAATGACYAANYCWKKVLFKEREGGLSESVYGGDSEHLGPKEMKTSGDGREGMTESCGALVSDFVVTGKVGYYIHHSLKKSRYLGVKSNGFSFGAVKSMESCLLAHQVLLYREEDVYSSCAPAAASPCVLTMRPLLVNNVNQVISFPSVGFSEMWLESEERELQKKCGLKHREELVGSFEQRNRKINMEKGRGRRRRIRSSTSRVSGGQFHSQGAQNGMLLFFIGITIGIMYAIIAHKRKVDKLNELLKQTQKLVQDFHEEEAQLKDSLNLKELSTFEGNENQTIHDILDERELEKYNRCVPERLDDRMADDVEPMSKIEAELLAELELLELNVDTYSSNSTPDSVEVNWENKAVSPRELSLRLYEVIEWRLEARIVELETALEASQTRVLSMDFEHVTQ